MSRNKVIYYSMDKKKEVEILPGEKPRTIRIHLTTGDYIEIELFERPGMKGRIGIRSGHHNLVVEPHAANVLFVGSKYGKQ